MVAPRADGVKILFEFGIVQVGGNLLAHQLRVPVGVEHLHHHRADGERIRARPGLRAVVKQAEFGGQRIGVLVDEEIDAACVFVEALAVGWG